MNDSTHLVVARCTTPDGFKIDVWFVRGSQECALPPARLRMLEEMKMLEWFVGPEDKKLILRGDYIAPR